MNREQEEGNRAGHGNSMRLQTCKKAEQLQQSDSDNRGDDRATRRRNIGDLQARRRPMMAVAARSVETPGCIESPKDRRRGWRREARVKRTLKPTELERRRSLGRRAT